MVNTMDTEKTIHDKACWLYEAAPLPESKIQYLKQRAMLKAVRRFGSIAPCGNRKNLHECFILENDALYFWFNSPDMSTHVVMEKTR